MSKGSSEPRDSDLVETFVLRDAARDASADSESAAPERPDSESPADAPAEADMADQVFARCDAAYALTPKLAESPALAWAFAEARAMARSGPSRTLQAPWYRRLAVAWSAAALAASACAVIGVAALRPSARGPKAPVPAATTANITFAPIIVPTGIETRIAQIEPVVLIAETVAVDGRSVAVIPFAGDGAAEGAPGGSDIEAAADAIYQRLLQQLAAIPGLYVIDSRTTAPYADTELTPEEIARYLGVRSVVQGQIGFDGRIVSLDLTITDAAGVGRSIDRDFARPIAELAELQGDVTASLLDTLGAAPPGVPPVFTP